MFAVDTSGELLQLQQPPPPPPQDMGVGAGVYDVLGMKQSPSFHDWDNIGLPETFMANPDAVGAAHSVERELRKIDARFEGKLMNAFGTDEEVVLQRFQELRRRQVDLSRRQVELLSRKPKGRFDGVAADGLDQLAQDMQKLCSMIAEVESLAEPEKEAEKKASSSPKEKDDAVFEQSPRDNSTSVEQNSNNNNVPNSNVASTPHYESSPFVKTMRSLSVIARDSNDEDEYQ